YTAVGAEFDPMASGDNCGVASVSYSLGGATTGVGTSLAGKVFNKGTTTVTWTVTDTSGHTAMCSFDVVVSDNQPPTISCPADIVTRADPSACGTNVSFTVTASDNCGTPTVVCKTNGVAITSPNFFPMGTTLVECSASDGSSPDATCSFNVKIVDFSGDLVVPCWRGSANSTYQQWAFSTDGILALPEFVS